MRIERNRFAEMDAVLAKGRVLKAEPAPMQDAQPARRSPWPWPGMIFVLLGANVAIVMTTIFLATGDPSAAVEPEYYQKALRWDEFAAQRDRNLELGWSAQLASTRSGQPLAVRLLDRESKPIAGATLSVETFHNAHSGNRLTTTLDEIEPGLYRSSETLTRVGSWEIRLRAVRGDDVFTATLPHQVLPKEPAP